jgi:hypothetical protein
MYVENGTSKMAVSELTVILEVPFVPTWLLYTIHDAWPTQHIIRYNKQTKGHRSMTNTNSCI